MRGGYPAVHASRAAFLTHVLTLVSSRTPSRSPNRAAAAREPHRTMSNPLEAAPTDNMPTPSTQGSASAHAFSAHPSSHPHEPTISEEASAYVGRSVSSSQSAAASATRPPPLSSPRNPPPPTPLAPPNASHTHTAQYTPSAPSSSSKRRQYRQVGDWILQKTLGQGSMGKVKLGVNVHTQERVSGLIDLYMVTSN